MHTVQQIQALHVVGIALRTRNEEAFQTIPPHWQRFSETGVLARIPARLSDDMYAVYTQFENAGRNNQGLYTLVIGAAVPPDAQVPDGMVRVEVPASRRAVFTVPAGRFDLVGAQWHAIWAHTGLPKTYLADYERYPAQGDIEILIGIAP